MHRWCSHSSTRRSIGPASVRRDHVLTTDLNVWAKVRLFILPALLAACLGFFVSSNTTTQPVHAFSAGPPAGYTGAPGEEPEACAECHVPPDAGTGTISITAPQTYVPGQTYPITVTHTNSDPTRLRWGLDRKSTRLNSSHLVISYAVFCLKKKNIK